MKNYRVIFAPDAEDDFDHYLVWLNDYDAIGHERQDMDKLMH